jgi:hypothetical protein
MESEGTPARDDPDAEDLDRSGQQPGVSEQLPEEGPRETIPDDDDEQEATP